MTDGEQSAPPHRRGGLREWMIVGVLMATFLVSMIDRTILALMVEPIQRDFGISDTQFGLLLGFAFALFYSIAGIPLGWLVDRLSRTKLLAAAVALWSLATILTGFSSRYLHLFLARVGVGIGEATLNPAAYSMMSDMFDARQLSRAMAVFYLGSTFGLGAAFLFGGSLASLFGGSADVDVLILGDMRPWQIGFLLAGAPGILLALIFLCMKEPPRIVRREPETGSWAELWRFVRREYPALGLLTLAFSALNTSTYAVWGWAPASFSRTHALDPVLVGVVLAVAVGGFGSAGLIVGGAITDRTLRRIGGGAPMIVGATAVLLSIPFGAGFALADQWLLSAASLCLLVALLFLTIPGAMAGLQLVTPPLLRGRVSAIFMMIVTLAGVTLGPLLVGLLNDELFADSAMINRSLAVVFAIFLPISALAFWAAARPLSRAVSLQPAQAGA